MYLIYQPNPSNRTFGDVEEIKNLINLSNKIKRKSRIIVMIDYILYDVANRIRLFKKFAKDLNFNFSIRPGNPFQLKEKKVTLVNNLK